MNRQRTKTDCLRTCISNVLNISYEEAPDLVNDPFWIHSLRTWARQRGYLTRFDYTLRARKYKGPMIGVGSSPRIDGKDHAVLVDSDYKIIHDPALSGGKVDNIKYVIVFTEVKNEIME